MPDLSHALKARIESGIPAVADTKLLREAAAEIELLRQLIGVEREIQAGVCKERDHWFKLVPNDVARANPFNPKQ